MEQRYVLAQESDLKQLVQLSRIIAEGKFEIKGDTILTVANSLRYLAQLTDRFKQAAPVQAAPAPVFIPTEAPVVEVDTSKLKGRKRAR